MYCVIQEIEGRKIDNKGYSKSLEVYEYTSSGNVKYSYGNSDECFVRDNKKVYKISIHESYREDGKVKKRQWAICRAKYYDLANGDIDICDFNKADEIGIADEEFYKMIHEKLDPLVEKIVKEFRETEEYKVNEINKKIIEKHNKAKEEFEAKYGKFSYQYCYDVFGKLRNKEMLELIEKQYEEASKSKENSNSESSYENDSKRSYRENKSGNYNDNKDKFKRIYKVLAIKFHPDKNNGDDEMMKFINSLKDGWGI
ncbi:MAG: hypothetical protein ACRDA5_04615 [Clostridium sp.]